MSTLGQLSVQITNIDHYMGDPGPFDRNQCPFRAEPLNKVPVIRVFGSTPAGQKTCLHIHQVYPYFYVPFTLPSHNPQDHEQIQRTILQFGASLNQAIALARQPYHKCLNDDQYIAAIVLVKGIPFYGFHVGYQTFLKIHLLNPADKQRALEILQSGALMGTTYQPYEAHLPFELQFMMDYNLYGMQMIHIVPDTSEPSDAPGRDNSPLLPLSIRFRQPLMDEPKSKLFSSLGSADSHDKGIVFTASTVPSHLQWDRLERTSYCELEIDTTAMTITNRLEVSERHLHMQLRESLHSQEKLVTSLANMWLDEEARCKQRGYPMPFSRESTQEQARRTSTPWASEETWREMMARLAAHESGVYAQVDCALEYPDVMTAFESVESLYPPEYYTWSQKHVDKPTDMEPTSILTSPAINSSAQDAPPSSAERSVIKTPPKLQKQDSRGSHFNVSATPSRYRDIIDHDDIDIDEDLLFALSRSQSFNDGGIADEVVIGLLSLEEENSSDMKNNDNEAKAEQVQEHHESEKDAIVEWMESINADAGPVLPEAIPRIDFDEDRLMDSSSSDESSIRPFRPQKLRQGTNVRAIHQTNVENSSRDIDISDCPPEPPIRHKRRRRLPQYDGPADSSDDEAPDEKRHEVKDGKKRETGDDHGWYRVRRMLKRHKDGTLQLPKNPYVIVPEYPAFKELFQRMHDPQMAGQIPGRPQTGPSDDTPLFKVPLRLMTTSSLSSEQPTLTSSKPQLRHDMHHSKSQDTHISESKHISHLNTNTSQPIDTHRPSDGSRPRDETRNNIPEGSLSAQKPAASAFNSKTTREYTFRRPPTISKHYPVEYREPFYSNPKDVPTYPIVFSGKEFRLRSSKDLKAFQPVPQDPRTTAVPGDVWQNASITFWKPVTNPPSFAQVQAWLDSKDKDKDKTEDKSENDIKVENDDRSRKEKPMSESISQLEGPTILNSHGFEYSMSKPKTPMKRSRDYLDLLSIEIHVNTREDLLPDPQHDAVQMVFWCLQTEDKNIESNGAQDGYRIGIITTKTEDINFEKCGIVDPEIDYVDTEEDLFFALVEKVRMFDPDLLVGYELNNASWGYLVERAMEFDINLLDELSRAFVQSETIQKDSWGYRKAAVYRVPGRHMINVWRMMRGELALTSYTFENVAFHILHSRVPHFSHQTLTSWHLYGAPVLRHRLCRYYLARVQMNLDMLDVSDVINRSTEAARVFGIDFYSAMTRGSQFKVESIMFRIAKPENFLLITPSRQQVAKQRAAECTPLILEPVTKYYSSPVIVLDFQSLYPSVMIAYNYCYSTCLGKVRHPEDPAKFGVKDLNLPPGLLQELKDEINVSPNGVMFVKPSVRKSLLARMLSNILETRVMVKASMKENADDSGLLRFLDARQRTLKYIANVTYGYTAANYSGRMPAAEIADSIVQTGRETLQKTIQMINETERWGATVVYGDTDSVFVHLPGRSREDAFSIGAEIADTITSMNPSPVRLKFEKVYHPCVLLAKKRYVGFKYERVGQTEPEFDAKGIETVRRDGTPATQKIMESSLKILFRSQDMSELKEYLYRQWSKILANRVSIQDLIIAREVRVGTYTERGLPNGAKVAEDRMTRDPRAVPQYGERVPYVVVHREPNARLRDKVVCPEALLNDSSLRLDAEYYIRKLIIPPLARVFNLVGVDISAWYEEMPRSRKLAALSLSDDAEDVDRRAPRIDQYYSSSHCIVCRALTNQTVCEACQKLPWRTVYTLMARQRDAQARLGNLLTICDTCSQVSAMLTASTNPHAAVGVQTGYADHPCDSMDCPVFFERFKAKKNVRATSTYDMLLKDLEF